MKATSVRSLEPRGVGCKASPCSGIATGIANNELIEKEVTLGRLISLITPFRSSMVRMPLPRELSTTRELHHNSRERGIA